MRKSLTWIVLTLVFIAGALRDAPVITARQEMFVIEGRVLNVIDGNTFTLSSGDKKHLVRIDGINVPLQSLKSEARDNLARLVKGKEIKVVAHRATDGDRRESYYAGKVLLNGRDIGLEQVRGGFAWESEEFAEHRSPEDVRAYAAAAEEAMRLRLGVWNGSYKECDAKTQGASPLQPASKGFKAPHNVSGAVLLEIVVDESGRVTSAKATCGHPVLQTTAMKDVLRRRFEPTKVSGQPVKVSGTITYNFVLDEEESRKAGAQ